MKSRKNRLAFGIILFIAFLLAFPLWQQQAQDWKSQIGKSKVNLQRHQFVDDHLPDQSPTNAYTNVRTPEGMACRQMTADEHRQLIAPKRPVEMHTISADTPKLKQQTGLKIVLRGTAQLEQAPEAKAAFQRAAARWEEIIQDPITIVVDVDYGTTRFGTPYPSSNIIGSTVPSSLILRDGYEELRREVLLPFTTDQVQLAAYTALPASSLPTDLGPATSLIATSPQFRMLGHLPAKADPDVEEDQIGPPPSIGFNSAFDFDFNPADGIDQFKIDFEAVAVHEIGHVLGFISRVGRKEQFPASTNAPTLWDFFRFTGGGLTLNAITNQQRLQLTGGQHSYFAGDVELELSTSDSSGGGDGDGRQASHWKDDSLTGQYIGIMDPALSYGQAEFLTAADVHATLLFRYAINPEVQISEVISHDDNSREEFFSNTSNTLYVNRFTPSRFPSTLHSLRILLGQEDPGRHHVRVVTFIDPNRTGQPPANPTLIADFTAPIPDSPFTPFLTYVDIPFPTLPVIAAGDLYIGVQTSSTTVVFGGDSSGKQAQASFVSTNNGASFQPLRNNSDTPANLMLRAIVSSRYGTTPTPIAEALSPNAIPPGSAEFTIVVLGSGFRPNSTVRWNGASRPTTFVNGRELHAQIFAADVTSVGTAKVSVATPTAGESTELNFSITNNSPTPVITRVKSNMAAVGVATTVNVFGRNFTSQSIVQLNGTALATTLVNSTQLTAQIPASALASAGVSKISVSTPGPGGGTSSEVNFEIVTCSFALSRQPQPNTSFGSNSGVVLYTSSPCAWTVTSDQPWITVTNLPAGNGTGKFVVDFSIAPNTDPIPRTGNLTIGGETLTLRELGRAIAVSAANFTTKIAPDSVVALFGAGLADGSFTASTPSLPDDLGGTRVWVTIVSGGGISISNTAQLFYAGPNQINFLMPMLGILGTTPVVVRVKGVDVADARPVTTATAPGLFTATSDGAGIPAAVALRLKADGSQIFEPIVQFDSSQNKFVAVPIDLGPEGDRVFVILFGTGFRSHGDLSSVTLKIGDVAAPVLFAGPQGEFAGLDQVNAELPRALAGRGNLIVNLKVGDAIANAVTIVIK